MESRWKKRHYLRGTIKFYENAPFHGYCEKGLTYGKWFHSKCMDLIWKICFSKENMMISTTGGCCNLMYVVYNYETMEMEEDGEEVIRYWDFNTNRNTADSCWGRLKLYKEGLSQLKPDQLLNFGTDSIIYSCQEGQNSLLLGDYLDEFLRTTWKTGITSSSSRPLVQRTTGIARLAVKWIVRFVVSLSTLEAENN